MTNQAIITLSWKDREYDEARGLTMSSNVIINNFDGVNDVTVTINKASDESDLYNVEITVFIDMTKSYSAPRDDVSKSAVLADMCQRLRGALYTESMNHRNGNIREGLVIDMYVHRWDSYNWRCYDENYHESVDTCNG